MAVPFVGNVSPAVGPPSGTVLVRVLGGGFRIPDEPVLIPGPIPEAGPTVEVTVGGAPASKVIVASAGKLYFQPPKRSFVDPANGKPLDGPFAEDIVITNLDNSGVPIAGETVTVTDGFTYQRVDLSSANPSRVQQLWRTLLRLWKSETITNVVDSTHTDFDDTETDLLNITALAQLPAIILTGPDLIENRFFTQNQNVEVDQANGDVFIFQKPRYVDLEFDVTLITNHKGQLTNLIDLATIFLERNKYIYLDCGAEGQLKLEMDFVQPNGDFQTRRITRDSTSNIHASTGRVGIKALTLIGFAGVENEGARDATRPADEIALQTSGHMGENLPDAQGLSMRSPPPRGGC